MLGAAKKATGQKGRANVCDAGSNRAANIEWQQDENHEGWEGRCFNGHVHRTADVGQECECGSEIEFSPAVDSTRNRAADEAASELARAVSKFGPMASAHEGYAVILEELEELWAHVKANTGSSPEARQEAIQLAAMALRYVTDVCDA